MKKRQRGVQEIMALVIMLVLIVVVMALSSNLFLSPRNLTNLLIDSTTVGMIAVFTTMLMIAGGLDLSVASTAAHCGVMIGALQVSLGLWPAVIIALATGAFIGLINGLLVTYVGINALITTLGMLSIARGLAFVFSNGLTIPVFDLSGEKTAVYAAFAGPSEGRWLGLPYPVWLMLLLFVLGFILLNVTTYGRAMYAIGGNEEAAALAALPVRRYRVTAYVLSGLSAALAAVFRTSRLYVADPRAAPNVELTVITAVVLGGTSLTGGQGRLTGTLLGVLILSSLLNGMKLQSTSTELQNIVQRLVLLIAVGIDQLRNGNMQVNFGRFKRPKSDTVQGCEQGRLEMKNVKAKIGVFGIGLAAYWPQFEGLKERLEGYQAQVEAQLKDFGADVTSAGLVDDAAGARAAGDLFARENVDLIVCYVGTYATSSQVLPAVQRRRVPVLVLNLQPVPALDYLNTDTAEWLANCCACCVPEIANAFARSRIQFNVVTGLLSAAKGNAQKYHERAWTEIKDWVTAARVLRAVQYSRVGFLGHTYAGMLDMYTDPTMVQAQLNSHVELLEIEDLDVRVTAALQAEVDTKVAEIKRTFDIAEPGADKITQPVTDEALEWSARVAVGLDKLVTDFDLHGLTYYYKGLNGNRFEDLGASVIVGNSLLTARGVPASGEGDLKTCLAMMIMDRLGAGGSYTEFYAIDFNDDFILMGHDGPGHVAISDQKPVLRGLGVYHGKRGAGISVEFKVKTGPVTILGMTQTADGQLKLIAAEGQSIPGDTMQIGNTNSRLDFGVEPDAFFNAWCAEEPTHHCALGVGHHLGVIKKFSRLAGIELAVVS